MRLITRRSQVQILPPLPIKSMGYRRFHQLNFGHCDQNVPKNPKVPSTATDDDVDGVSPIALKWMRRSQLSGKQLSALFSLGIEEIDLVAKSVPGKSKAERVRSVALLLGIAGYLSSGVARVADDKLREACGHYDAYDGTNFSKQLKAVNAEVTGSKESGYTLSSRGLTSATELIKSMVTAS
jgi:hypothetical protein